MCVCVCLSACARACVFAHLYRSIYVCVCPQSKKMPNTAHIVHHVLPKIIMTKYYYSGALVMFLLIIFNQVG